MLPFFAAKEIEGLAGSPKYARLIRIREGIYGKESCCALPVS